MKRFMALLIVIFILFSSSAITEYATPTDINEELYTFEDDDYGYIEVELLERQVFLEFLKEPKYFGEEVTLIAILINFRDNDIYRFEWEESEDGNEWHVIIGANEQTYTFIINHENVTHYWRVKVYLEE